MAVLCGFSIPLGHAVGPSWTVSGALNLEPKELHFRIGEQVRVILPELEEHKILSSIPFATRCMCACKATQLKTRNNKNKPFLWLLCWQKISVLWASSVDGKNSLSHVSHSLNAKKAVFKRQKQRYNRGGISVGPWAKFGSKHYYCKSLEQSDKKTHATSRHKARPKQWSVLKKIMQKGQAVLPWAQVDKVQGAGGATYPSGLSWESRRWWPLVGRW